MKTLALFCFFGLNIFPQTYAFIEEQGFFQKSNDSEKSNWSNLWIQKGINKKIGIFGWAQIFNGYRQAYAGTSYQISNSLQIGVGGGVENIHPMARLGTFTYFSKTKHTCFGVYERGGSGVFYMTFYNYQIKNTRFGLGTMTQKGLGSRPRVEQNFGNIKFYQAFLRESSGNNLLFGVRFIYSKN